MQLEPNQLFHNRYRLIEMKGRGSFGEVWLAHDEQLDMDVAIKVYIALDDRGVAEFKSEYKTTFGLNHPNLLHATHFDQFEKRPYLVMPFCPGAATNYIGNIDEATVWRFIRDVASGLEYLHNVGIIHHDIKPDNVLIDTEGNFLITDFGISKKIRSTLRRNSMRQVEENESAGGGSISYMGPEMFGAKPESVNATDIWALGATLYEMCEGELPFFGQGGGMQLNGAQIPEVSGNYSDDLKQIIQMCLAKETWDRPQASQLREYAQAKLDGQSPADFCGMTPPPAQPVYNSGGYPSGGGQAYPSGGGQVYPSGGGQVYQSGDGSYMENSDKPKKKSNLGWWIGGIAALVAIVIVALQMMKPSEDPEQVAARENQATYSAKVNTCQSHIDAGKYGDYEPLLTAQKELQEIKYLEDKGKAYYPNTYNHYMPMKHQLDEKMRNLGNEYGDKAKPFIGLNNTQAKKYFDIAKKLNPNYTSSEYVSFMNSK